MEPPWPPSPPLGPRRWTNFSRRNARHPRPPLPASTWMSTSSTKIALLQRQNADHAPACPVIFEPDAAIDLGENRVVLAEARVEAGAEPAASLPDDDGAAGHDVAVVRLDAEALRVRVAPVAGTALPFFMCHRYTRISVMRT